MSIIEKVLEHDGNCDSSRKWNTRNSHQESVKEFRRTEDLKKNWNHLDHNNTKIS